MRSAKIDARDFSSSVRGSGLRKPATGRPLRRVGCDIALAIPASDTAIKINALEEMAKLYDKMNLPIQAQSVRKEIEANYR